MGTTPSANSGLREIEQLAVVSVDAAWTADVAARLVRIPSVTGNEIAVQDLVASLLADAGLDVERLEPPLDAVRADPDWPGDEMPRDRLPIVLGRLGRPKGRRIVLVGHVDVVPVGTSPRGRTTRGRASATAIAYTAAAPWT